MRPMTGLIIMLLLITACTGCDDGKLNPGEFEDPAFKICVENTIDSMVENELVTRDDPELYNKIKMIGCGGGTIRSIKGIENMPNVDWFGAENNQIESLGPLRTLTKLTFLKLDNNKIKELGPLSGLTILATLSLSNNYIEDLSPLYSLTKLGTVWLDGNCITDTTQFQELKKHSPNVQTGGAENSQDPAKCQ